MTAGLRDAVFARLDALAPEGGLGVAVSGGGDSTALLLLATDWATARGRMIAAATVDHGLRPESAAEARSVAALCARRGVAHETLAWRGAPGAGNLSAAAREARIALLGGWARRTGLAAIALGHTMDDQAETVLLRLARGSGVDGLSAMAAATARDGVLWLRPLLGVRRDALRALLEGEGIAWAQDPTNDDETQARIRLRRLIAESGDLSVEGLAATAERLQGQRAALEAVADDLASRALDWGGAGEARIEAAALAAAPEDTALRLLARVLGCISGAGYLPRQGSLAPLLAALRAGEAPARTLQGCVAAASAGVVVVCREPGAASSETAAEDGAAWDGRWLIRGAPPGTRIARLGEAGEAALAALRRKGAWTPPEAWLAAPRAARLASPAIWRGEDLVAAPVAGYGGATAILTVEKGRWRPSRRDSPGGRTGT